MSALVKTAHRPPLTRQRGMASRAFEVLCRGEALSRSELRRALGGSLSAVTAGVQELRVRNLVVEVGVGTSTGGRRPKILDLAPDLGGVLGIDIGGINMRVAAADLRGHTLARWTVPTPRSPEPATLRRHILAALGDAAARLSGPVHAIAAAVAGVVAPETGKVSLAPNIPAWDDVDLTAWLAPFEARVLVENEANLAAIGEFRSGGARDARHVLFVAIGAGIGAGLILDGRLYRGHTGAAGEIGYMRSSIAEPLELERKAAAEALVERYRRHAGEMSVRSPEAVFDRLAAEDPAAVAAVSEVIDEQALALANAIALLDPQKVVLGGGMAVAGEVLLAPLRERIRSLVPVEPEFALSELGPDAALVGALLTAADAARDDLIEELERSATHA